MEGRRASVDKVADPGCRHFTHTSSFTSLRQDDDPAVFLSYIDAFTEAVAPGAPVRPFTASSTNRDISNHPPQTFPLNSSSSSNVHLERPSKFGPHLVVPPSQVHLFPLLALWSTYFAAVTMPSYRIADRGFSHRLYPTSLVCTVLPNWELLSGHDGYNTQTGFDRCESLPSPVIRAQLFRLLSVGLVLYPNTNLEYSQSVPLHILPDRALGDAVRFEHQSRTSNLPTLSIVPRKNLLRVRKLK